MRFRSPINICEYFEPDFVFFIISRFLVSWWWDVLKIKANLLALSKCTNVNQSSNSLTAPTGEGMLQLLNSQHCWRKMQIAVVTCELKRQKCKLKASECKIIDGETRREVKTKKIKDENDDFKRAVGEACWSHHVGRKKIKISRMPIEIPRIAISAGPQIDLLSPQSYQSQTVNR